MPKRDALIPILLGRFIMTAQLKLQMKMHYSDQDEQLRLKSMPVFLPSLANTKTGLAMLLWLGTLYVVIEGWQAAKLWGPSGSGTLTVVLNVAAVAVLRPAVAALVPGPGWLYTGTAVVYDLGMVGKSYFECKYGEGEPTPPGEIEEEPE